MATGTRIKDLDSQATRSSVLSIPVDHSSFTDAKQILISVLAPLISELSAQSIGNRATDLLRFNDGAGNEYKTNINDIYTEIADLAAQPGPLSSSDKLRYDSGGTEYRLAMSALASYLFGLAAFDSAVDARIAANESSVLAQDLKTGATTYGVLYMYKVGQIVSFNITNLVATSGYKTIDNYTLPTAYQPNAGASGIGFDAGEDINYAEFYGVGAGPDGKIVLKVGDASGLRICGSYYTAG